MSGRPHTEPSSGSWHDETPDEPDYIVLPESGQPRSERETPDLREPVLGALVRRMDRLEGVVDKTASQVGVARDEIGALAAEIREALQTLTVAVGSLRADGAQLAGKLEETEASLQRAVEDASSDAGLVLRQAAQAVENTVREASRTMSEEHVSTMARYSEEFALALRPIAEGLARVDRLGSLIEAMGKRRGFQELVRSERALREEQTAFVQTLSEASTDLSSRVTGLAEQIRQLEERLESASQDARELKHLPAHATERVARAVERLRTELTVVLQDRFSEQLELSVSRLRTELEAGLPVKEAIDRLRALAGTQADLAQVQRSIDGVVAALRTDVKALRDRIQSWGKPRTAPALARELDQLGGRLDSLEGEIREGLADRVARSVTDSVVAAVEETDAPQRRGLFHRP
jgi:archaellum component FlaC